MMKVQWLGGPTDGDWLELQDGMQSLEIYVMPPPGVPDEETGFYPDANSEFKPETRNVPIHEMILEDDEGNTKTKLVLDYYAKA